ncbi:MAG: hypothetical protein WCO00_01685 [Rhodospirillaceae bacterium]
MSISMAIDGASSSLSAGAALPSGRSGVEQAIFQASRETGVDFAYLMEKAAVESSFQPDLKATTSSATGLYQFIDSTWLSAMKAHGAEHGLGQYADAIQRRTDGGFTVADPATRKQILDLRKDPKISAVLAAELTKDNKTALESRLGGTVGSTELYLAHFLGASGAGKFLEAMRANPLKAARDVVPEAAASNTPVFYDRQTGQPKTLAQVYDRFAKKFGDSSGEIVSADRSAGGGAGLTQMIRNVASGKNPMDALKSMPLTGYTMLALAALQTPDESRTSGDGKTPFGSRRMGETSPSAAGRSVNDGRDRWWKAAS